MVYCEIWFSLFICLIVLLNNLNVKSLYISINKSIGQYIDHLSFGCNYVLEKIFNCLHEYFNCFLMKKYFNEIENV